MFDAEFYPTPKSVIRKMVEPYRNKIEDLAILEPSAGKGDILDFIKENYFTSRYNNERFNPYCLEKSKDLQFILNEKKYRVIGDDFLSYSGDYFFDLIIMNPPFSNGDEHLLHAWNILKEGDICCLLNAETLNNPFSERRKLIAKLIEDFGSVEFLGSAFQKAERTTDAEIAIVRLAKKEKNNLDFNFEGVNSEDNINLNEDILNNQLMALDTIGNMVLQYERLKETFVSFLKANDGLKFYSQGLFTEYATIEKLITADGNNKQKYNSFCDNTKLEIWKMVIDKTGMQRYMTNNVRQNFSKFITSQGSMDFTKENVKNLIRTLILNKNTILENAITDIFDLFTKYHKENRCYIEGWKTNDKWKVNMKVILPGFVETNYNGNYSRNVHHWDQYSDIEKVMCYITGKTYESITHLDDLIRQVRIGDFSAQRSEFFTFRCYKKGTLHIEFNDPYLWEEFNLRACAGKNWLPEAEQKEYEQKLKMVI